MSPEQWEEWLNDLLDRHRGRVYIHPDSMKLLPTWRFSSPVEENVRLFEDPDGHHRILHLRDFLPVGAVWIGPIEPGDYLDIEEPRSREGWHWPEEPTAHRWVVEEVDSGHLGVNDFWACEGCGAGGGPHWGQGTTPSMCFYVGTGIQLPTDCGLSKAIMAQHAANKARDEVATTFGCMGDGED